MASQTQADVRARDQERLRRRFRALILQNPNYFGNLVDSPFQPVVQVSGNTTYEDIGCVGYHPQLERLHAVVYIKQTSGYGGDVCSAGSTEYVRFYLSFDGGATWDDQGVASFNAYDISGSRTHLEYAVTRKVDPPRRFCFWPNLILARAILSWNAVPPPNDPGFTPVWGNVHDTHIEVEPRRWFPLKDLFHALEVKLPDQIGLAVDLDQQVGSASKKLTVVDKAELYRGTEVEPHRFALAELQAHIDQPMLTQAVMSSGFTQVFPDLDIDLSKLGDLLFPTDGSILYEELECVGYDDQTNSLVGVLRIKRPNGYSGGPCTAGSQEYVTFWADVNGDGTFETCLGTAVVGVHDYTDIPDEGLEYSVLLKTDLRRYQQPCEQGPRLIPVRAILSWEVAPPCANPDYVPVWGNREETVVHVPPGPRVEDKLPVISSVGDMAVPHIDATGYATGAGVETGFAAENSPFGGRIDIAGKIVGGTSATRYRALVKPHGAPDSAYVPITNEPQGLRLTLVTVNGGVTINPNHVVHADGQGYYPYEDYAPTHFVDGNLLMRWFTGAAEHGQSFDLRVDVSIDGNPANDVHSQVVTVRVDNQAPDVHLDIDLGTGVDCADFATGATFNGTFSATDEHFRRFWFQIEPSGPAHGVLPSPPSGHSIFVAGGTIADPGVVSSSYTLDTTGMDPCGYALILNVESRTNVNSGVSRHRNHDSVGFCLREPQG
ncbi:MAG TPA: hypothetical protein VHF25_17385 [Nitriliruptorales bacterium]|nr:hypothetical protein [Nitriliruptorales bacterium]